MVNLINESFRHLNAEYPLRLIIIDACEKDGLLHGETVTEILDFFLNYTNNIDVVCLPRFKGEKEEAKVIKKLWELRGKCVVITYAHRHPGLPGSEVISVGVGKEMLNSSSSVMDLTVDLPPHMFLDKSQYYGVATAAGIAGAIIRNMKLLNMFGRVVAEKQVTHVIRNVLIELFKDPQAAYNFYWGFGRVALNKIKPEKIDSLLNSVNSEQDISTRRAFEEKTFSPLKNFKIKVAFVRNGITKNHQVLNGWNIQNYKDQHIDTEAKSYPDNMFAPGIETTSLVCSFVNALSESRIDNNLLKEVIEIYDVPILQQGWRVRWDDWSRVLGGLKKYDIVNLPVLAEQVGKGYGILRKTGELKETNVVITSASTFRKTPIPTQYPAQCVISVGCGNIGRMEKHLSKSMLEKNVSVDEIERFPLMQSPTNQEMTEETSWQSVGSTLDFVCKGCTIGSNSESPENSHWAASFYATAIVTILLIRAHQLGFDEETINNLCKTSVMHGILRQMCSHPTKHEMEDGWGYLDPWTSLDNPNRLHDLIATYAGKEPPVSYWTGKNI